MTDRWWDDNPVRSTMVKQSLIKQTVTLYDVGDLDITDATMSFVGMDAHGIFAGFIVTLTNGLEVTLYGDGRVCDDSDNEIGRHKLYK